MKVYGSVVMPDGRPGAPPSPWGGGWIDCKGQRFCLVRDSGILILYRWDAKARFWLPYTQSVRALEEFREKTAETFHKLELDTKLREKAEELKRQSGL